MADHNAKTEILQNNLQIGQDNNLKNDKLIQAFLKASKAVLRSDSFNQIAREIFDISIDLIGAKSGYIALLSDDGQENELLFLEAGGLPCSVDPELPMPIRGLRAEAYRDMKVVFDNDFMNSQWVHFMPMGHVVLDNVLFAPLNIEGKTVGIMGIANKPQDFTEDDAEIAAIFGELAAIALQRTRDLELQKQLTEDLKFYNEALENFASIVSHDLREPLRTISSFLQFIEDKYSNQLDSEGKEFIQFAINGSKRMDNMIKGLLAYSRVGGNPDKFKITSMDKILRNVINDLNELIIEKKAIITSDSLPEIYCDETLISELLQNLIGNSIKYSDKVKPKIHISAEENDDKWIFSVNDNGIGFDSETVKDNIFLMFKRIHIDQEFEGRGIGLATCKKIINIHEGEIWAKSKPGEGATFYFSTPKYPQSKKH